MSTLGKRRDGSLSDAGKTANDNPRKACPKAPVYRAPSPHGSIVLQERGICPVWTTQRSVRPGPRPGVGPKKMKPDRARGLRECLRNQREARIPRPAGLRADMWGGTLTPTFSQRDREQDESPLTRSGGEGVRVGGCGTIITPYGFLETIS